MGIDCEIKFENCPSYVVPAGQHVAGTVNITVHNVVKVKKLTFFIEGFEECEWAELEGSGKFADDVYYRARNQYLNIIDYLILNKTEIQPGRYLYKFMFQVPERAPCSLQESNGKIFYRVRVVFNRPWKIHLEFTKHFLVSRQFDLNLDSRFRNSIQEEKIMRFGFWLFKSDYVNCVASIPQNGFVVGQSITIKVVIDNPSTVKFSHIETILRKHVEYTSQTPKTKSMTKKVSIHNLCHKNLNFESARNEFYLEMTIPDTVPSTNSRKVVVIKISYSLLVIAKTKGMRRNLRVSIPITIGTVPIATSESNLIET